MKGRTIKTLYLIRHAKTGWKAKHHWDFLRQINKKGIKDLEIISTYLAYRNIMPDIIISSCAQRAQDTTEGLAKKIGYFKEIDYMKELYLSRPDTILDILSTQNDDHETMFLIGHTPALNELVKLFTKEKFTKFPTLGIMALKLDINGWRNIVDVYQNATVEFFIYPKQFKYYTPLIKKKSLA